MSLFELAGVRLLPREGEGPPRETLSAEPGDCLVAFGLPGSGKHELLRRAAGVLDGARDAARVSDPRPGKRLPLSLILSEGGLINNLSLLENAALPALYHRFLDFEEAKARARRLLEKLGVGELASRRPEAVGHGARRLAQLARALLLDPSVFILDNPLAGIDAGSAQRILSALDEIKREARAAVLIVTGRLFEHYLGWGTRFLWIREGALESFAGRAALERCGEPELRVFLP